MSNSAGLVAKSNSSDLITVSVAAKTLAQFFLIPCPQDPPGIRNMRPQHWWSRATTFLNARCQAVSRSNALCSAAWARPSWTRSKPERNWTLPRYPLPNIACPPKHATTNTPCKCCQRKNIKDDYPQTIHNSSVLKKKNISFFLTILRHFLPQGVEKTASGKQPRCSVAADHGSSPSCESVSTSSSSCGWSQKRGPTSSPICQALSQIPKRLAAKTEFDIKARRKSRRDASNTEAVGVGLFSLCPAKTLAPCTHPPKLLTQLTFFLPKELFSGFNRSHPKQI